MGAEFYYYYYGFTFLTGAGVGAYITWSIASRAAVEEINRLRRQHEDRVQGD